MAKPTQDITWASADITDPGSSQDNKVEPSSAKKTNGWSFLEKPPFNWFNYWMNAIYLWVTNYGNSFEDYEAETTDGTETEMFVDGVTDSRLSIADGITSFDVLVNACIDDASKSLSWKIKGCIHNDGTTLFLSIIKELLGGLGWDITDTVYTYNSFSVTNEDGTPADIFLKPDGRKMYMVGSSNDNVYEYNLSIPWDINTATYTGNYVDISGQSLVPTGIFIRADGLKLYVIDQNNTDIFEYNLSTAWDIGSAVYSGNSYNNTQEVTPQSVFFSPDGTKMYLVGSTNDRVYEYNLGTPWDVSTASYSTNNKDVSPQDNVPTGIFFSPDGAKMYMIGQQNNRINQYNLGTPWDVSTASYTSNYTQSEDSQSAGLFIKSDGIKLYVMGLNTDTVYQYDTVPQWNIDVVEDQANEALILNITGEASTTINWKARLNKIENAI